MDDFAPDSLRQMALQPIKVPFLPPSTIMWLIPSGLKNLKAQSTKPPDDSTPFWLYILKNADNDAFFFLARRSREKRTLAADDERRW